MKPAAALLVTLLVAGGGCRAKQPEPNLVLVSIDTCRAVALGCYGGQPGTTPNADRPASQGVVFENAISPVPITRRRTAR
jgi:arylsulfatase A-like enzyme